MMGDVLDAPVVVLLCLMVATLLLLVELALPTLGTAGTGALVLSALGIVAIDRQDADWWPLVLTALAVCLWAVMLARRSALVGLHVAAVALFGAGAVLFGVVNDDAASLAAAVALTVAAAIGFPPLFRSAQRLLGGPPQVGMETIIGKAGRVVRWDGDHGSVRVDGSLWNADAAGTDALEDGDNVVVVAVHGMNLLVARESVLL